MFMQTASLAKTRPAFAPRAVTGFTLTELMVVVAIAGILAAIAYPGYINSVRRSNRTDATRALTIMAQTLERCYSQNFAYALDPTCPGALAAGTSSNGYYTITVVIPAANQYTIAATPLRTPQTGDNQCQTMQVNQAGVQSATDSGAADSSQVCWGST